MAATQKSQSSSSKSKASSGRSSSAKKGASGGRCWKGFEPVPGKKPFSKGSCKKK